MDAQRFNSIIQAVGQELLVPHGFEQKGLHHFLHDGRLVVAVIKNTWRGDFMGLHLALAHDFHGTMRDQQGRKRMPALLEDYPLSIELSQLQGQYAKKRHLGEFTYDLNFLVREVHTTRNRGRGATTSPINVPEQTAESYVRDLFTIAVEDGIRLRSEYTMEVAYWLLAKHRGLKDPRIERFLMELEEHATGDGSPLRRRGWWTWFR